MPTDAILWSKGKALLAVGIPVDPVPYEGTDFVIGQANNALLYPGLGLGVIVSGASHVSDGMLIAAAEAVASQVDPTALGASLLPPVDDLRASSAIVALAVAKQAAKETSKRAAAEKEAERKEALLAIEHEEVPGFLWLLGEDNLRDGEAEHDRLNQLALSISEPCIAALERGGEVDPSLPHLGDQRFHGPVLAPD